MAIDFTINGHRYTNDPALAASAAIPPQYQFIGYNAVVALGSLATDVVALAGQVVAAAATAASSAASAVLSPGTSATSTTSLAVGYGDKTIFIQPGKYIVPGMALQIASAASPKTIYMHGIVGAHNPATGQVDFGVDALSGLASVAADWIVSLSAPGGASLGFNQYTGAQFFNAGIFEGMVDLGAGNDVNVATGTLFKKTPSANWALTVSGIPAGASASFIIELTNAGFYSFTPPAGTTYPGGITPSLSTVGTDVVGFYKYSGGNWRMLILAKAIQ